MADAFQAGLEGARSRRSCTWPGGACALPRAVRAAVLGPGTLEEVEYPGVIRETLAALRRRGRRTRSWTAFSRPSTRRGSRRVCSARRPTPCSSRFGRAASSSGWSRTRSTRAGCCIAILSRWGSRKGSTLRCSPPRSESASRTQRSSSERWRRSARRPRSRSSSATGCSRTFAGADALGMTTVQALWFRADENPDGAEPDHQAFTQMDVLNIADRLLGSA